MYGKGEESFRYTFGIARIVAEYVDLIETFPNTSNS